MREALFIGIIWLHGYDLTDKGKLSPSMGDRMIILF